MSEPAQETIESTIPAPETAETDLVTYIGLLEGLRIKSLAGLVAWAKWEQEGNG